MRRIVMFNRVSADGYFAVPDGNLDWSVPEDEIDKGAAESLPKFDTMLFGRRTYEMFASFWPHALDDSPTAQDPHGEGRRSKELRAMAVWINETPKVVFSRTLKKVTWQGSRLVHELDPGEIEAMKKKPGKDMIIFGSGSLVSQLSQHGLIDEYQLIVTPVFLGNGKPLLTGLPKTRPLELLEAKSFKSGNVSLRYAPRG
jgi:dihydrofolate reductase